MFPLPRSIPLWQAGSAATDLAIVWFVQSALVISFGLLAAWLLRRRGAPLRNAIYRTTLAAAVACPLISAIFVEFGQAPGVIAWNGLGDRLIGVREQAAESAPPPAAPRFDAAAKAASDAPAPAADGLERKHDDVAPAAPADGPPSRFDPAILVALISLGWLAGSTLILARLAWAHLQVRLMYRRSQPASEQQQRLCGELARRLGVRTPRLARTPAVASPCLTGLFRPVILLPDRLPAAFTAAALVHELAHLRRGDLIWNFFRHVAGAALFFQPLMWRLSRDLESTAESVCDDYAIQHGAEHQAYAKMLVTMANRSLLPVVGAVVPFMTQRSLLEQRVAHILDGEREPKLRASKRATWSIFAAGLVATLAVAAVAPLPERVESESGAALSGDVWFAPADVFAGSAGLQVGDRVVAIEPAPITNNGSRVDRAFAGWLYQVERVDGDQLWVNGKTPGWLDARHVVPFDWALGYFDGVLALDPEHVPTRRARAIVLLHHGKKEAAFEEFSALIDEYPGKGFLINDRGRAYAQIGDYDRAVADYSEAARLQPVYPVYFHNRASARRAQGDVAAAIRDYKHALVLRRHYYPARMALADIYASCPDGQFRDGAEAVKHATVCCELTEWRNGGALDLLAAAHAESGQFDEALERQTQANALHRGAAQRAEGARRLALYQQGDAYRAASRSRKPEVGP